MEREDIGYIALIVLVVVLFIYLLVTGGVVDLLVVSILAGLVVKFYSSFEDIKETLGDHSRHLRILSERVRGLDEKIKK